MSCRSCEANKQLLLLSEINVHLETRDDMTVPSVWAFPELAVCLQCGFTEFRLGEPELSLINERVARNRLRDRAA